MISQVVSTVNNIFVDISALEALIDRSHPDHTAATQFLHTSIARNFALMSSQQVLYSIAENLRSSRYEELSSQIINALRQSELIHFEPLNSDDEKEAWRIFSSMQNSWWTFSRCASMALINRLKIKTVFAFEPEFIKFGFRLLPKEF